MHYLPQFVRMITEKLMTFGIGRGMEYQDMPVIRSIVRDADKDNDRFVSILMGIIPNWRGISDVNGKLKRAGAK